MKALFIRALITERCVECVSFEKCVECARSNHVYKYLRFYICSLHPMPEGQIILILSLQGQNFKMSTSAKHEGYISIWARVRSMRVPNTIHHEGIGCKRYKDERYKDELFLSS